MENFDVVVVGGGPGGSTAATFVAAQGHRVLLLEKEKFPVYKIGESLLPCTVHGICSLLGVSEELKAANFVRKAGGTFRWGKNKEPWTFAFAESTKIESPISYAYQVERMKFDTILLNNARRKGVDVREQHSVADLILEGDRVTGVQYIDSAGERHTVSSKYVVDASGYNSALHRMAGDRIFSEFFRNIAIYGYFNHGKRMPAPNSGNIFCAAFDQGWFWYIPLSDTLTSVGAVIGQEHAHLLKQGHEVALSELISSCEPIRDLLSVATRVTAGPYGEVRIRKDYSYSNTKFWRPGLVLIGDAACFIDPVFSSGVHLATYSALLAARSINTCIRGQLTEERAFTEFENRYRREYGYFYDFLRAFYDLDQGLDSYYWAARKIVGSQERDNEAFIQLVAGVASSESALSNGASAYSHTRDAAGEKLFPASAATPAQPHVQNRQSSMQRSAFMEGLIAGGVATVSQAVLKGDPVQERPMFPGGLVPSDDGFHWSEARRRYATVKAMGILTPAAAASGTMGS